MCLRKMQKKRHAQKCPGMHNFAVDSVGSSLVIVLSFVVSYCLLTSSIIHVLHRVRFSDDDDDDDADDDDGNNNVNDDDKQVGWAALTIGLSIDLSSQLTCCMTLECLSIHRCVRHQNSL